MAGQSLHLGVWQDGGVLGDVHANLAIIRDAAGQARSRGADVLVFPECFLTGYYNGDDTRAIAARVDAVVLDRLAAVARAHGVALLVGYYETAREAVFNAALFVDDRGNVVANYRKRALFGDWEQAVFSAGGHHVVFDYRGLRFGILICFDVEFPELVRDLARRGVDAVLVPTSLMSPYDPIAAHVVVTRAIENQLYVAYANRVGTERELAFVGQSVICDPTGQSLARASADRSEMLVAKIETSVIAAARAQFSYLTCAQALGRR